MKLTELPVFFLDLQTTGARPASGAILEMAWSSNQTDLVESFIVDVPDHYIPRHIFELTGISVEDLENSLPMAAVIEKFQQFLKFVGPAVPAVIHYAQFERPFLEAAYHTLGMPLPFDILCTHEIAKRLFPNLPARGIKGLAGYYGYVKEDLKRSSNHVEATRVIWQALIQDLLHKGLQTYEELRQWLSEPPQTKRTKYEYPLKKEKRLKLPDRPCVYRMLSKKSEVLYVGKATSLKDRVNSYFRGKKGRDPRKLEMLTQVWDLQVTPCETPLEAALLETDEIKKYNPRYNVNLKAGQRKMVFYDRECRSISHQQDEIHPLGPFSSVWILDSIIKLRDALETDPKILRLNPSTFFDPIDGSLLEQGYLLFCERHGFDIFEFTSIRHILAVGLNWYRQQKEVAEEYDGSTDENLEVASQSEEIELKPNDIADKLERHFIRAAAAFHRACHLTRLLDSVVEFESDSTQPSRKLTFIKGQLSELRFSPISRLSWQDLEIDTYDRMSILYSELMRMPRPKWKIKRRILAP
jgi:DNA polymerase-3 subunit epsilon